MWAVGRGARAPGGGPGPAGPGGRLPVGGRGRRAGRAWSAGACCRSWTAGGSPSSPWSTAWGGRGAPGGRGSSALAARLAPSARPSVCARALPPGRPLGLLLLFLLRPSPPPRLSLRGRHGRKAARLCPVLPCPGGDAGERAREYGKGGYMRERRMRGSGGGSQSLWSHRSPVCKEWCVCECARVRACVAVGGGVPGVLQHQTEPRGGKRIRNDRTTADPTLNPSPAGAGAASPRTLQCPLRCPPPPQSSDCPRVWGLESARRPLLREGAAAPEGAWSRSAFPEAPLLREAGLLVGMSVM